MRSTYANVVRTNGNVVEDCENIKQNVENTDSTDVIDLKCGLILIAKKLTGTENFGPWKRSITIALSAKNKLGLVNGSVSKPEDDSLLKAQWDRVNDMVISWILNTVSDEISTCMDFVSSAQEVWNELHDQFASIDGHRV